MQGVDQVDSYHIRFAIFDSHSQDRTGAIAEDGSSLLAFYDTLKLLARHIRCYAASVEQVNADFTINYMNVVPFDLLSIVRPPSLPPDIDRPGSPSEDTDVGSCSYKSNQSSPDDDSPRDSPSVSPSASPPITLSEEEEKKEDLSYELCSGHGRSRARGPGASGHVLRQWCYLP